jgi:nitrate/nitrite transporter NarK
VAHGLYRASFSFVSHWYSGVSTNLVKERASLCHVSFLKMSRVVFCLTSYFITDDCPRGNYAELKRRGAMAEVSATMSFIRGSLNCNTWLLFIQYAACFGVELTMNNAASGYFREQFDLTTESAAAVGKKA